MTGKSCHDADRDELREHDDTLERIHGILRRSYRKPYHNDNAGRRIDRYERYNYRIDNYLNRFVIERMIRHKRNPDG